MLQAEPHALGGHCLRGVPEGTAHSFVNAIAIPRSRSLFSDDFNHGALGANLRNFFIWSVLALFVGAGILCPTSAWTQDAPVAPQTQATSVKPIGKVVSAKGTVTIQHVNAVVVQASLGNAPGTAKVGDPVYLGDILQTGKDGRLGINFADGAAFNLSVNSRMVLNEFVYDPNGKSNSSFVSLTKGALTFVAGKVATTGNMTLDTPVGTMGIRGTTPHVQILENGTVKFYTLSEEGKNKILEQYGAATVTPNNGGVVPNSGPAIRRDRPNLKICNGC